MRLRLKAIVPNTDFRKSEATIINGFKRSRSYPGDLNSGEAFLFLSKTGNQLLWFFNNGAEIEGFMQRVIQIIDSRKWRVTGGIWHPFMLANYAEEAGIELVGIRRFEEIYDERRRR